MGQAFSYDPDSYDSWEDYQKAFAENDPIIQEQIKNNQIASSALAAATELAPEPAPEPTKSTAKPSVSELLAELGGDTPPNRAIAEGLQKQGIASTKNIEVRQVPVGGYWTGTDEASYYVPESTAPAYFNKATGQEINPTRLGIIQNGQAGVSGGDIFYHLTADANGNVGFTPQWSPRAHGFLRDNPVGQAIMAIGKIIPVTSPFFLGASAIDAAAHGKLGVAAANLLPIGLNQLAGSDLLGQIAGNPNFDPNSVTSAGKIAEALGVPSQYADVVGKVGASELGNQLKGGPTGMGALGAVVGEGVKSGIGALGDLGNYISNSFAPNVDIGNISEEELNSLYGSQSPTGPGSVSPDLSLLSPDQLNAIYAIENPGAILGNLPEDELNSLYGSQSPTGPGSVSPDLSLLSPDQLNAIYAIENPGALSETPAVETPAVETPAVESEAPEVTPDPNATALNQVVVSANREIPDSGVSPAVVAATTSASTPAPALTTTAAPAKTTEQAKALTSSDVASLIASLITGAITTDTFNKIISGEKKYNPAELTKASPALTTVAAQGMQALPTAEARYWRQTGAQGNEGKGGVRFFDWYDTPENRTMAPSTMEPTNAPALAAPVPAPTPASAAKQYFNQETNRYYTDPTGTWQPPAGWNEVSKPLSGGGIVDDFLGGDVNFYGDAPTGMLDSDVNNYLMSLPSENASYDGYDRTASYQQDIKDAAAGAGSGGVSSALKSLLQLAKDNPNLTKALLAGGLGAALGYAGRPKPVAPMGMQAGSLGLTQSQVHNALKGVPVKRAMGGEIDGYAGGGGLHYLKSAEDGMADRIAATIDNKQPAKLSGGEFVIPADVVSHLGNGNSEAGAKQLYDMMDRIRHARTGTKKQGKQINPAKFTPK